MTLKLVVPAGVGAQWRSQKKTLDSRLRGNDASEK
jgi:hypothetical protein